MSKTAAWRAAAARAPAWICYLAIAVAVIVPLLMTLGRLQRPFGEKVLFSYLGGSADLGLPYSGARALLAGIDLYMPVLPPAFRDPAGWPQTYPPTMLLMYVPFVLATHSNLESACEVFYWLNIGALAVFAVVIWRLARWLRGEHSFDSLGMLLVVVVALGLNTATAFAIDRGQSELINAALCWTAVLLFTRRRFGIAMVLVTLAAAVKGYAAVLALGLLLAVPTRRAFIRAAWPAALTTAAVTLPVASHIKAGLAAMLMRNEFAFSGSSWHNHSFKSLFYNFNPARADDMRHFMLAFTAVVCVLSWWRLASAMRHGAQAEVTCRSILFASSALAFMVGMPAFSGPYNYTLVLPGLVLLATSFDRFVGILRLRLPLALPLGLCAAIALALALQLKMAGSVVTLGGIALVYLVLAAGILALVSGKRAFS